MDWLLERIFTVPTPAPRVRTKPMQVLCVGPSRSGTESLSIALQKLDLNTFHGWDIVYEENVGYTQEWTKLLRRKYEGAPDGDVQITADEFDALIGDAEAVIDVASFFFAAEMIQAYPDAKVILNIRRDLDAWHRSAINAFVKKVDEQWIIHLLKRVNAEVFWQCKFFNEYGFSHMFRSPIQGKPAKGIVCNGKWAYREHCNMIRGLVPKDRLLEWGVEDGWEPLCEFLGKPLPDEPFPNSNNIRAFETRINSKVRNNAKKAIRNLVVLVASVGVGVTAIVFGLREWSGSNPLSWVYRGL